MKQHVLLVLVLFSPVIVNAQCMDTPTLPAIRSCFGAPTPILLGSFGNLPSGGTQKILISFVAQILDLCGEMGEIYYLSVSLYDGASDVKICDFKYNQIGRAFGIWADNMGTLQSITSAPVSDLSYSVSNKWIEFAISLDFVSGSVRAAIWGQQANNRGSSLNSFNPTWIINSNSKFYIGSDINNLNPVSCHIQDLKVRYETDLGASFSGGTPWMALAGLSPVLIAYYPFNEGSGATLNNLANTNLPAYRGSSSATFTDTDATHLPVWTLGGPGIDFTTTTQYITLPTFIPQASNVVTDVSLSISFWMKPGTTSIPGYIFRHSNSVSDNMALKYTATNKIAWSSSGATVTPQLNIGPDWTLINFNFAVKSTLSEFSYSYWGNTVLFSKGPIGPIIFSNSDVVRIGGPPSFIGQIAHFKIMSPGSTALFGASSCIPGADIVLGISSPTTVLQYQCDPTCSKCFGSGSNNCLTCPSGIKIYHSTCVTTCPQGSYDFGSSCIDCPSSCSACTDSITCQSCKPGFSILNTDCILSVPIPPVGTPAEPEESSDLLSVIREIGEKIAKFSLLTASFCLGGNFQTIFIGILSEMIEYLKYVNVTYSDELIFIFHNWDSNFLTLELGIPMPETVETDQLIYEPLPRVFTEYELHPSLLHNFWDDLLNMGIVLACLLCFVVLEKLKLKKIGKLDINAIINGIRIRFQNLFLTLFYEGFGNIVFLSVIEYRSIFFNPNLSALSFAFCCIFLITGVIVFILHWRLLLEYQRVKRQKGKDSEAMKAFLEKNKGVQVLFADFEDQSLMQQAFLVIFIFRDMLFSIILANLFEHPDVEGILFILLNCGLLIYLLIKRPIKNIDFVQLIICELALLIVNSTVTVLAFIGDANNKVVMSKIIIYIGIIFNFIPIAFLFINLAITIKDACKKRQQKAKSQRFQTGSTWNRSLVDISVPTTTQNPREVQTGYRPRQQQKRKHLNQYLQESKLEESSDKILNISLNNTNSLSPFQYQERFFEDDKPLNHIYNPSVMNGKRASAISRRNINNISSQNNIAIVAYRQSRQALSRSREQFSKPRIREIYGNPREKS